MLLFGSFATGTPTPRSDADLLVVVEASDRSDPRERIPEVLRALAPLPCPVDLFVLTSAEVERARAADEPLVRVAETEGLELL